MTYDRKRVFPFTLLVIAQMGADEPTPSKPVPAYKLVPTSAQRVRAELNVELKAPKVVAEEWWVYAVSLPELPGRQVAARTALTPRGRPGRDLSPWSRPLLIGNQQVVGARARQGLTMRVEYEAILVARKLIPRKSGEPEPPEVPPLDPKTRRLALEEGRQFDFEARSFQEWLDKNGLRRTSEEDEIDFARRAFDLITTKFEHYESAKPDRRASQTCTAGKTGRAGLAILYVATLRANKIPSLILSGRRVSSTDALPDKSGYDLQTVKSTFHALGVGWVPVDVPEGVFAKTPEEKRVHFGNDPGDFLTVHFDTNVRFDTIFGKQTLELLPDASWWVRGEGSLDGLKANSGLKVQFEPLVLDTALRAGPLNPPARKPQAKAKRKNAGSRP